MRNRLTAVTESTISKWGGGGRRRAFDYLGRPVYLQQLAEGWGQVLDGEMRRIDSVGDTNQETRFHPPLTCIPFHHPVHALRLWDSLSGGVVSQQMVRVHGQEIITKSPAPAYGLHLPTSNRWPRDRVDEGLRRSCQQEHPGEPGQLRPTAPRCLGGSQYRYQQTNGMFRPK
ncbi:nectin-4-like isoform X1 [Lates japonicus]|uniref:Nectin-4-like isoform X1 n=1 Tax=Lates japonicus TaxID=270547 RepID=A0AAD3RD51_LATJO|nr:nectin-4-like isoform X1 [Lates japonicus]